MRLDQLQPKEGSRPKAWRLGRGIGSGNGKTSGRGHKGQKARSGGGVRPGFEGGQMPLTRRIPKRGFTNIFRKKMVTVNLEDLNRLEANTVVTPEVLLEAGIIKRVGDGVKVLANGEVAKPLILQVAASKQAAEKVIAAGGKVEVS